MVIVKKILQVLTSKERSKAYALLIMILFMALLDVVGIASVIPFFTVLADPSLIESNAYLSSLYSFLGFENKEVGSVDSEGFLFSLGAIVFFLLVFSISFKAFTTYTYEKFAALRNYSISKRLLRNYLGQPYEWFLNQHSSELGRNLLNEVNNVVGLAVLPLMRLFSHSAVVIAMVALLLFIDPFLAITSTLFLSGLFLLIYLAIRRFLGHIGEDRVLANKERFKIVQEGLGGIKDIKIFGLEKTLLKRFENPALRMAGHTASQHIAGQLPRFFIEILAFGGMILIVLYLMTKYKDIESIIPLLSLYALAALRLIPALQQVYAQITQIRFSGPALDLLHKDLTELSSSYQDFEVVPSNDSFDIKFSSFLELKNLTFRYGDPGNIILNDINIKIARKELIGVVGSTGSGKTTLIDIILGLLSPSRGSVEVDGIKVNKENLRSWQKLIGYVPQEIYLSDETIYANIGFGLDEESVDKKAAKKASKIANLHKFITEDLEKGYSTPIGERGVRLSGGQRQRIGIARALYYDPEILIFDEATSSLDNVTERGVMEAIHSLGRKKTIILIAHRLSTVKNCDRIFVLEKGEIIGSGNYEDLLKENFKFKEMVSISD